MRKLFFVFSCICFLLGCGHESKQTSTITPITSVSGKLFRFGPEKDSLHCQADGGCDCCMSDMLFLNDSQGVYISYCIDETSYFKFRYTLSETAMTVHFSPEYVEHDFDYEVEKESGDSVSNLAFADTLYIDRHKIRHETLSFISCGSVTGFEGLDGYGFQQQEEWETCMEDIHKYNILHMLHLYSH